MNGSSPKRINKSYLSNRTEKKMIDELTLKNFQIDASKLLKLGFTKEKDYYKYEAKIMDNQFLLSILIDKDNNIKSKVIELSDNEEFLPYNIENTTGEFVGYMREEYNSIIENIKKTCCSKNVYRSTYSNLVIKYIKEKYNDDLEYLWKNSNNAIWRNKNNSKWYAALLIIDKSKLGINELGQTEIINLQLEPETILKLVDNKKYFKAYHMNKKYWISIKLDGSVNLEEIYKYIDNSYDISMKK